MRVFLITCSIFVISARKIIDLPGLDFDIYSDQYAGYLNISETQRMFYWFIESQNTPSVDPLVFWFNGGPGCSSLFGLFGENGPFMLNENGTFQRNEHGWSRIANVVYLESPVDVGFSYSTNGDGSYNDHKTAEENYAAIKIFLKEFPQFRNQDIFLTGQSYAGIYIPMLADRIVDGQSDYPINLKGIAIGNGVVDLERMSLNQYVFGYSHSLIGYDQYQETLGECCNGTLKKCQTNLTCSPMELFVGQRHVGIDYYDITRSCKIDESRPMPNCGTHFGKTMTNYLHFTKVKETLQIPDHVTWEQCRQLQYFNTAEKMKPYVEKVVNNGVRVFLYYGDKDKVCDFMQGQQLAASLNFKKLATKSPWYFKNVLAGYKTIYEGLTFTTIRGAGHSAPQSRPAQMLYVIQQFFNDEAF